MYYYGKTKATLASKVHWNAVIKAILDLSIGQVKNIRIPIIQIMGLSFHIYSVSLIDKNLYIVQKLKESMYPKRFHELNSGGILNILKSLAVIDVSILIEFL